MIENRIVEGEDPPPALVALARFGRQVGVSDVTLWRWRRKGWLQPVNICGKLYLTRAAIELFTTRAARGDFAQAPVVPAGGRAA